MGATRLPPRPPSSSAFWEGGPSSERQLSPRRDLTCGRFEWPGGCGTETLRM